MDLRRLHYFFTVAQLGSFSKAAKKLGISQPPLSKRIQELEEELGILLFDRNSRPIALTLHGKILYEQATDILQKVDFLINYMKEILSKEKPTLKLGFVPANFHANLSDIIKLSSVLNMDINFQIKEMNSLEQIDALRTGEIDIGIGRIDVNTDDIKSIILYNEPMVVVLPQNHHLSMGDLPVPLAKLRNETFILYTNRRRPSLADFISSELLKYNSTPKKIIEMENYDSALILIAAGKGVSLAPESAKETIIPGITYRGLKETLNIPLILNHRNYNHSQYIFLFYRMVTSYLKGRGIPIPDVLLNFT